jgi:hypothetical protein
MSRKVVLSSKDFESRLAVKTPPNAAVVGFEERKRKWDFVRTACAQALVADPQILLYFKCKNRNPILSEIAQIHALLCKLIELVQESVDFVPSAATTNTAQIQSRIERILQGESTFSSTFSNEVAATLQTEVKGSVVNKRLRERPTQKTINALILEISRRLGSVKRRITDVLLAEVINDGVRELARRPILQKLHQALGRDPGPQRVVDCALSLGALNFSDRKAILRYKVSEADGCPLSFKSKISGSSVELTASPSLLGIQAGDTVFVGQTSAQVLSVTGRYLTLSASLPTGTLTVHNPTYAQFDSLREVVTPLLTLRNELLDQGVNLQNRPSVAAFAKRVALLSSEISALTRDAHAALTTLGVDTPDFVDRLTSLRELSFSFPAEVVDTGEAILRSMREEGFIYAADLMFRGNYGALFDADPRDAANGIGSVDASLANFSQALKATL